MIADILSIGTRHSRGSQFLPGCIRDGAPSLRRTSTSFFRHRSIAQFSTSAHIPADSADRRLKDLPGLATLPGEKLVHIDATEAHEQQIWQKLPSDVQASLLQPRPDSSIGFKGWLGKQHSQKLEDTDYVGLAGVLKLFTDREAEALAELAGTGEGKHTPSKAELEKQYVGRYNTLRQAVKDKWLTGALWQRLFQNPGDLPMMEYWSKLVGANSELRLVRTQPPRASDEKAGQHLKHVDTREDNKDYVDLTRPDECTRVSIVTVQCYLNPQEHDGGEFVAFPARLNLADPSDKKKTILYETNPESSPEVASVKVSMRNGECVVFLQESDQLYHGGAPVTGDKDKIALRFVLDMQKKDIDVHNLANLFKKPEYGLGYTNDRSSIKKERLGQGLAHNTINCVARTRVP